MIIRTARFDVLSTKRQELMQTLKTLVSKIRNATGCQGCSFYQDTKDENRFILTEKWANQEALDKHLRSHRYRVLVGAINLLSKKIRFELLHNRILSGE